MKTHFIIALCSQSLLVANLSAQLQIFVSPTGSDSAAGTIGAPFKTLSKARDHIRTQQPLGNGAIVNIRGGEYFLTGTLAFSGTRDSGKAGAPIIYSAYNGEQVTVSGARSLNRSSFVPVTNTAIKNRVIDVPTRDLLLQINLGSITPSIDLGAITRRGWGRILSASSFPEDPLFELFVGGKRQRLARWPNPGAAPQKTGDPLGSVDLKTVIASGPVLGDANFATAGGTFTYDFTNRPASWSQATDIWLSGTLDRAWEWDYIPIASIDSTTKQVTLGQGVDSGITTSETFFHFENLLEEIDEPGEYYIDRTSQILYIYPPADFDTAPIRFTSVESTNLITTNGANYMEFHDLVFEGGRNGGMEIKSNNFLAKRCTIRNFRGTGMQISGENLGIVDSIFTDLGGRGIIVGAWGTNSGIGDRTTLTPGNVYIENCEFSYVSQYQANYTPAIHMLQGVSPRISHCYFHDNPHFSIGGRDNNGIIEYCEFTNTPALLADVGAIYYNTGANPSVQGTLIRRNYFHDIGADVQRGKMSAVYLDNASRGITIEENIFNRIGMTSSDWAVFNHGAAPGNCTNNVFIDCVNPITHAYALIQNTYMKITDFAPKWETVLGSPSAANLLAGTDFLTHYPELNTLIPEDGNYESRKAAPVARISRNLFHNPNVSRLNATDGTDDGILVTNPPANLTGILSLTNNFIATSNPGFTNLAADDISFTPSAGVYSSIPGFNDPEFKLAGNKQMGLIRSAGPKLTASAPAGKTIHWDKGAFFTGNSYIGVAYQADIAGFASDTAPGATLTFKKVSGPAWLSVSSIGVISGTPTSDEIGLNHFAVRATSSTGESDEAILRIVMEGNGNQLVFTGDIIPQREAVVGRAYHGSASLEVSNPDWADLLTFSSLTGPAWLSLSPEGKLTGTPPASDLGENSWTLTVSNDQGAVDDTVFTVNVVSAPSTIIYVNGSGGSDSNNGTSWAQAKATLNGALSGAPYGSEVWVAQGTYGGSFQPPSGVSVFGGFASGDTFADRNPQTKPSIHSPGNFKVVAKNDVLIDGFTLQNAPNNFNYPITIDTATDQPDTDNIVVRNCKIINNLARAAILVRGWQSQRVHNVSFLNCQVSNNSSIGDYAGNIAVTGSTIGEASFERCLIHSNAVGLASVGGGSGSMDFSGTNALRVENSIIYGNTTQNSAKTFGILVSSGKKIRIANNTLDGNGSAGTLGNSLISLTGGSGIILANNAFINSPSAAVHNTVTGASSTQNCFFSGNATAVTGTNTANSVSAINALAWAGANQLGTAQFINAPARDYRLLPGSLLIDTGSQSLATASDITDIPRILPDIGAYEYDANTQDSDGDLMTDAWEASYGLALLNPSDANTDLDGDGMSNLAELITGTLPNSGASVWHTTVSNTGTNQVDINFNTVSGRVYRLERSTTLGPGSWTTLGTYPGTGSPILLNVPEAANQTNAFYRVGVNFQ